MIPVTQTIPVSIRISPEKANLLDDLAKRDDRSRNYVINTAIDAYLAMRQQWDEGILQALQEVEEGKVSPAEEVFARLEQRLGI